MDGYHDDSAEADAGRRLSEVARRAAIVAASSLVLAAGCGEGTGDGSGGDDDSSSYEVTDGPSDRTVDLDEKDGESEQNPETGTSDSGLVGTGQYVSFDPELLIEPPNIRGHRAKTASLHFDGANKLYIGYLLPREPFGGGIDILNAKSPTTFSKATSLLNRRTDVQALASPANADAVYVAEAEKPKQKGVSPAQISVVRTKNGNATSISERLTANVAKSVVVEPTGPQTGHDLHVINDDRSLYRFHDDLGSDTMLRQRISDSSVDLMGLAIHRDQVFTMAADGQLYYSDWSSPNPLQSDVKNLEAGIDKLGIARLHAYDEEDGAHTQDERIFAALGRKGFAVLDDDADDIKYRQKKTGTNAEGGTGYYTSVTLHGNVPAVDGSDLAYAARRNGVLDIYRIPDGGVSNGLDLFGRVDIYRAFRQVYSDDVRPQLNYALGIEGTDKVYVSGGERGTVVLDIDKRTTPEAIDLAVFCSTGGSTSPGDVSVNVAKTDTNGDPISIDWSSTSKVNTVVLRAGYQLYNYSGGTKGTVPGSNSTSPGLDQTSNTPCPSGESPVVQKSF